ncbi:MAG: lipid-A-disaccharide synthase [Gammaproteobacteria bacterium]|nr:lipid-A-disaccharide synthase [Gammaproteobacteria bacterium]
MSSDEYIQIAIVAGEPSGDSLGAGLISAVLEEYPNVRFVGVGGTRMEEVGCEILYHMERIGVMGIDGLFGKLADILKIRKDLYSRFSKSRPALFIGIDVPDFNLTLERKLKKSGISCVHYVSPTVWAWRGYRIHKIRDSINHMLTLFPFEAAFYEDKKVPVTYVGHPFADEIASPNRSEARRKLGLSKGDVIVALLPGSRRTEVRRLSRLLVNAAAKLHESYPEIRFLLPFANQRVEKEFYKHVGELNSLPITTLEGQARLAIEASNIAVVASGTVALEAAILRRPHIVIYKLGRISYWLMKRLRHVDHYSMPNHLLPKPMIPELIQDDATVENIVREVNEYLKNKSKVQELEKEFEKIHRQLKCNANIQAKNAIAEIAGLNRN